MKRILVMMSGALLLAANLQAEDTIREIGEKRAAIEESFEKDLGKVFGPLVVMLHGTIVITIDEERFGDLTETEVRNIILAIGLEGLSRNPYMDEYEIGIVPGSWIGLMRKGYISRAEHKNPKTELDALHMDWASIRDKVSSAQNEAEPEAAVNTIVQDAEIRSYCTEHGYSNVTQDQVDKVRAYMKTNGIKHVTELGQ